MCLEAKEKKNEERLICALKCSKNVQVRPLLEAEIHEVSANVFKGFV